MFDDFDIGPQIDEFTPPVEYDYGAAAQKQSTAGSAGKNPAVYLPLSRRGSSN